MLAPAEGEAAPRNARIWLGHVARAADSVELRNLDLDDEVTAVERGEIELANGRAVTVLTPRELLEPGEYALVAPPYPQTVFEVVDEIDTAAPEVPDLDPPAGRVLSATARGMSGTVYFGFDTPCGGNGWPGGKRVELRFASFDVAGNFSLAIGDRRTAVDHECRSSAYPKALRADGVRDAAHRAPKRWIRRSSSSHRVDASRSLAQNKCLLLTQDTDGHG